MKNNFDSFWQTGQLFTRGSAIASSTLQFAVTLAWDGLTGHLTHNQNQRATQLSNLLIQLGPTFIKLGQILSCRPDLVPPVYTETLANLQDSVPPFSYFLACDIIEEELGKPCHFFYQKLTPIPVASASFGQVYKGKLITGETVAVKVQRPGLKSRITIDLAIVRIFANLAQKYLPFVHSDLVAVVDELTDRLLTEINYIQEGQNAQKFDRLYGDTPQIVVPKIYWKYTRNRVLTMQWVDGMKITDRKTLKKQGFDPAHFITLGFEFSLRQLLKEGYFHADPHPGNLLITTEGKLLYLDFGMVSEISPEIQDAIIASFLHLIVGDFEALAQDYVTLGFLPPETDLTPLIPKLAATFHNVRNAKVSEFGFKQSIEQLSQLIYEYPFQAPSYYLLVLRSFATLEGIAILLAPDLKAFELAYPYLIQLLLVEQTPTLTACLNRLLLHQGKIDWTRMFDFWEQWDKLDPETLKTMLYGGISLLASPQGNCLRKALVQELVKTGEGLQNQFWTGQPNENFSDSKPIILAIQRWGKQNQSLWEGVSAIANLAQNPETQRLVWLLFQDLQKQYNKSLPFQ